MKALIKFFVIFLRWKNPDIWVNAGKFFVWTGAGFLAGPRFVDLVVATFQYRDFSFELTGQNTLVETLGIALILLGVAVVLFRLTKLEQTLSGVLVFHKGMSGMALSDAQKALPLSFKNGKLHVILIDEGHRMEGGRLAQKQAALDSINSLPIQLSSTLADAKKANVKLAYAGLAPIPFLFAAGFLFTSRQQVLYMDFTRGEGWHCLDELDDDENLEIDGQVKSDAEEIALLLPFSVDIALSQVPSSLRENWLRVDLSNRARPDSTNSEEKQKRVATAIYTLLANQKAKTPTLRRIHIFLACQASMAARLGSMMSSSVHCDVQIYQYDPSIQTYTWGVSVKCGQKPALVDSPADSDLFFEKCSLV